MAIIITSGVGVQPTPEVQFYITSEYIFMESLGSGGNQISRFYDFTTMRDYSFLNGKVEIGKIEYLQFGTKRGWSLREKKEISRNIIDHTTFLGYECIIVEEQYELTDLTDIMPAWKEPSKTYYYACKVPDLEALPLQVRLHLPFYKEWKSEEYPFGLRRLGAENILIQETFSIASGAFPVEKVEKLFGIQL